ncbi:MAG TPA: hypothetical protein VET86_09590, partial [Casimicrobiaceae bacterium]|nr:hypothetical protein [Casimicrobiaceae bacterium]
MASPPGALRARTAGARIAAIADAGSVAAVDDLLTAPRPSPHLGRWSIRAQDERFLGGSAGANHADAIRAVVHAARRERPAAVLLLMASGGVRLH